MDAIGSLIAMGVGFFALPIFTAVVEFIINKSIKKDWGYTVSITVLVIQLVMMAIVKTSGYAP
jgi:hypothetical protein